MVDTRFANRRAAGARLVELVQPTAGPDAVVLGLPRGGVEVAAPIASALRAPLDVLVVRKVGMPSQPELAIGAVGEGGALVLHRGPVDHGGVPDDVLADLIERESAELRRRVDLYRPGRPPLPVEGRTVIVVDDGLATGASAMVALRVLRDRRPGRVVLAVPVGPPETVGRVVDEELADEVICPLQPHRFMAVGHHYEDFDQTTDDEVLALLDAHRRFLSEGRS